MISSVNLDEVCGKLSVITGLSYFNASFSIFLIVTAVPLNLLVLVAIIKLHHFFHRSFYLIIANIAMADMLCGVITNSLSVNFNLKEAFGSGNTTTEILTWEVQSLHYTFFVFNSVSVLSMALLSIDRLGILLDPYYYYSVMTKARTIILLVLIWVTSFALSGVYFEVGYIRYLAVFSLTTVAVTMIVMIVTMVLFKQRLSESQKAVAMSQASPAPRGSIDVGLPSSGHRRRTALHNFTQMDKRVTTTFLWMLLLFLLSYLPALIITTYMNVCEKCDCKFVHIMRDVVFLFILAGGLFRVVNFIVRLTTLNEAVKSLFAVRKKPAVSGLEFNSF